jgi:hypothetical protein
MGELIPLAGIIVGGLLGFPIVMGAVIKWIGPGNMKRKTPTEGPQVDNTHLEAELQQMKEELRRVAERQEFLEALLEKRNEPTALPRQQQ